MYDDHLILDQTCYCGHEDFHHSWKWLPKPGRAECNDCECLGYLRREVNGKRPEVVEDEDEQVTP